MKKFNVGIILIFALLFSVGLYAQRGRGHNKHQYKPNHQFRHNNNYNNRFSVRVVPRYNYYPSNRRYYRPAPVYRPVVRQVYRSPGAYVHFGPVFGLRINVLPAGYSRVYSGSNPYYYNQGVYYRSQNSGGGYEVVAPPLNATVNNLPANANVTIIDGQKFYQVGGTFYQEEISQDNRLSYRVVGTDGVLNTGYVDNEEDLNAVDEVIPTIGSRYDELPAESRVQVINQQKYFVSNGGVYYKEVIEGDKIRYEVTSVQ